VDPVETQRGGSVKIHLALIVALALYCLLFAQIRNRASLSPAPHIELVLPIIVLAFVQFAVISVVARKRLRSPVGQPAARARLYFLLRAVAAEGVALFGLLIGVQGVPVFLALALFALALAAMLVSFPTREAWQNALRLAESRDP
jgi:hypothetical protein